MVEISEATYSKWFCDIESTIKASAFICIDLEFLGLPSSSNPRSVSLFDTPEERYIKISQSIRKFPPCQLGLACFKEIDGRFEVDVFCIYLFKRLCKKVFSFSLSALTFLSHHDFDFNKLIQNGVTYLNKEEYAKIKNEILNNTFEYDTLTDKLESRIQMLKMKILLEATTEEEVYKNDIDTPERNMSRSKTEEQVRLSHPLLIELCSKYSEEEECERLIIDSDGLWDTSLTSIEASAIIYALGQEFPYFDFQLDASRTLLYVAETPLIFRNTAEKKKQKANCKAFLNELLGVSRIFSCIVESRKPLIGHNSLLDFMYIYNSFEAELPENYELWKLAMLRDFPFIVDTKILAAAIQENLSSQGVNDFSLQTLGNYFESPSCGAVLPFDYPEILFGKHTPLEFGSGEHYHNAGYDAFMTGKIFLKLTHLYAYLKCSSPDANKMPWSFSKLLIVLKTRILNKLPIPLIDSQHCNLAGNDPPGQRPDIIRVRKLRRFDWLKSINANSRIHNMLSLLMSSVFPPQVTENECQQLQGDLTRVLGFFRVEVKSDGSSLFIATNTAKSFARVCHFFTGHDDYYLVDEANRASVTYENRLMSSRKKKEGQRTFKEGLKSIIIPVSCSSFITICAAISLKFFIKRTFCKD